MESEKLNKIKDDIKQKQVAAVKDAARLTLEKIHAFEKSKNDIQEQLKILKSDLIDIKEGRLDRILERHQVNDSAKEVSVLSIKKCDNPPGIPPWYEDYLIFIRSSGSETKVNCSIVKTHASGTYKMPDGEFKYLN